MHVRLQTSFRSRFRSMSTAMNGLPESWTAPGSTTSKTKMCSCGLTIWGEPRNSPTGFAALNWPRRLGHYANLVNPLKKDLLRSMDYYWVTAPRASTRPTFCSRVRRELAELYPRLLSPQHAVLWRQGSHALSWATTPSSVSRRGCQ